VLDGLCTLLRGQSFAGVKGAYAVNASEDSPRPQILVSRSGGDGNDCFDPNDGSLINTEADFVVRDTNAIRCGAIADAVVAFLRDCWPVEITCVSGNREIVWVSCTEPVDDGQSATDGSDKWDITSTFAATIQHTPA